MPAEVKGFAAYGALVDLLQSRGMNVGDPESAVLQLQRVSYYRLSGYWYPFRRQLPGAMGRSDQFYDGTTLSDVMKLYNFDSRLRTATFDALAPVELHLRAVLGHELGEVHECAHLEPSVLGPRARQVAKYENWRIGYTHKLATSNEEFIAHHRDSYGGTLPTWVAVEILDWGSLTYLFGFSPRRVQDRIAGTFRLSGPQLESWMRSLNFVRNVCAHHGGLFNRVHPFQPRLPRNGIPGIDANRVPMNRTFGQLCLIQHMLQHYGNARSKVLAAVLRSFPTDVWTVPLGRTGAPPDWESSPLWAI